jgi:hypothetical protein
MDITLDGTVVGAIANNEAVEVSVEPGHHTLRLGSGRHRSRERSFDVAQDGRWLSVPRSEDLADVGGGAHQSRPVDLAHAGLVS